MASAKDAEYEGYIVKIENTASLFSDIGADGVQWLWEDTYIADSEHALNKLLSTGNVSFYEPNYVASLFDVDSDGWAYDTLAADYPACYGLDGGGVRVAVIDSGVDLTNSNLEDAHIQTGCDYIENTDRMTDDLYHGTKVTQIIAGDADGNAVTGIARGASVVPLRCFSQTDGGTAAMLAQAIRDAVDVYHCDIINMSWGMPNESQILHEAIQYAADAGAILIAAAGNVSWQYPQGTVMYPAAWDEVIGVGAVSRSLAVSNYSQRTEAVYVAAPGEKLTFVNEIGRTVTDSGTSFAAPCIAAEAAVLKQLAPWLDGDDVMRLIQERAVDLGETGFDTAFGWGITPLDSLLSDHWGTLIGGEPVKVGGWRLGDGSMVAAEYDEDGKMLSFRAAESSAIWDVCDETAYVKLFWVDDGYKPLCECGEYKLTEEG